MSDDVREPRDEEALSTEGEGTPGDGESWKREVSEPSVISDLSTGDVPDVEKLRDHAEATANDSNPPDAKNDEV